MTNIKAWVQAARPRTLPLSLSGIIVGAALALKEGFFDLAIFFLALLTTIAFQITSNFANDYGDGTKGTDGEDRIGPARVLQSGLLSRIALRKGILMMSIVSILIAVLLIYKALGIEDLKFFFLFLILAVFSIWAAIKYTMGSNPYGYKGLGDVFVFLFFGLLGVLGSMYLFVKSLSWSSILLASAIGFLCVGVLNLNNLRDVDSDGKHGKKTLVVKIGFENGKRYHFFLIVMAFTCFLIFSWIEKIELKSSFYLLAFIPILIHLKRVMKTKEPVKLDGELKKLALSTFLLSFMFLLSIKFFL